MFGNPDMQLAWVKSKVGWLTSIGFEQWKTDGDVEFDAGTLVSCEAIDSLPSAACSQKVYKHPARPGMREALLTHGVEIPPTPPKTYTPPPAHAPTSSSNVRRSECTDLIGRSKLLPPPAADWQWNVQMLQADGASTPDKALAKMRDRVLNGAAGAPGADSAAHNE